MTYKDFTFDFECGIELFTVCNYNCDYCSGPRVQKELRRGRSREDADHVVRFFNETGKCWLLGLSGGEPSIHPHFATLLKGLREQHFFYFFTNLSFDLDPFVDLVPPERVQYIKASLHPKADTREFLSKFSRLNALGYNPVLIMVSAPDQFDRIEKVATICRQEGYNFTLSVMEGPYQGKNYPNDYTAEQQIFIEQYTEEPGNLIRLFSRTAGGMNTYGLSCSAGARSFYLDMESGELMTCESSHESHGNVYTGVFLPRSEAFCCPAISGCVGYDRCLLLPDAYRQFFQKAEAVWTLKKIKHDQAFPENLYNVIRADDEGASSLVHQALEAIRAAIAGRRVLFWGAGIYGAKILYYLRRKFGDEALANVAGFIDSLPDRQKMQILGLPVYPPDSPEANSAEIILITSYAYEQDICKQIERLKLPGRTIPLHRELLTPMGVKVSIF